MTPIPRTPGRGHSVAPSMVLVSLLVVAALVSCSGSASDYSALEEPLHLEGTPAGQRAEREWLDLVAALPYDSIELQRSSCLGLCPEYSVRLRRNGTARWHGLQLTPRLGVWSADLPVSDYARIVHFIDSHHLTLILSSDSLNVTDEWEFTLRLWPKDTDTTVVYHGLYGDGPTDAWAIRAAIDGVIPDRAWREDQVE